ncbi:MAG: putative sulfate exporter family transporter [Fimbriimonadaceae bacterium]|nr:MAG: putative sulfate exporter family transporter [Fimbriimonadaceae bacterium]
MKAVEQAKSAVPGLALVLVLALFANWLSEVPVVKDQLRFSALLLVILLGILIASAWTLPKMFEPGLKIAQKPILRWGVAGLGFRLTLQELAGIGAPALLVVVLAVAGSFLFCVWLGKIIGIDKKLGLLLATGGSICGASAIVAADTVVEAEGQDAAVSMGIITLWGTVGIFIFPVLAKAMGWADFAYGLFCGATLHETAQVVAAASGISPAAVGVATVVKLVRICTLAPMVFGIGWWLRRTSDSEATAKVSLVPWFLVMFCVFSAMVSFIQVDSFQALVKDQINPAVKLLLAVGMAGVGLQTNVRDLWKAGWKSVGLGLAQWVALILITLTLMSVFNLWK